MNLDKPQAGRLRQTDADVDMDGKTPDVQPQPKQVRLDPEADMVWYQDSTPLLDQTGRKMSLIVSFDPEEDQQWKSCSSIGSQLWLKKADGKMENFGWLEGYTVDKSVSPAPEPNSKKIPRPWWLTDLVDNKSVDGAESVDFKTVFRTIYNQKGAVRFILNQYEGDLAADKLHCINKFEIYREWRTPHYRSLNLARLAMELYVYGLPRLGDFRHTGTVVLWAAPLDSETNYRKDNGKIVRPRREIIKLLEQSYQRSGYTTILTPPQKDLDAPTLLMRKTRDVDDDARYVEILDGPRLSDADATDDKPSANSRNEDGAKDVAKYVVKDTAQDTAKDAANDATKHANDDDNEFGHGDDSMSESEDDDEDDLMDEGDDQNSSNDDDDDHNDRGPTRDNDDDSDFSMGSDDNDDDDNNPAPAAANNQQLSSLSVAPRTRSQGLPLSEEMLAMHERQPQGNDAETSASPRSSPASPSSSLSNIVVAPRRRSRPASWPDDSMDLD